MSGQDHLNRWKFRYRGRELNKLVNARDRCDQKRATSVYYITILRRMRGLQTAAYQAQGDPGYLTQGKEKCLGARLAVELVW